jgi:hypothetical protein
MIIINKGDPDHAVWWHQKLMKCEICGAVYQLEPNDYNHPYWLDSGPTVFSIECMNCRNILRINKEVK